MNPTSDTVKQAFSIFEDIPWNEIIKWVSIVVNVSVFAKWLWSKMVLSKFLLGRWEGNITNSQTNVRIKCILIVTESSDRSNQALFYYEQKHEHQIALRGVDELDDYDSDFLFIRKKQWKPIFIRQFHFVYKDEINGAQIDFTETIKYSWDCKVNSIWTKPKLDITIEGNGVNLHGILHKS